MKLEDALSAQEEGLLNCVHCGFCLSSCPTYVRLGDEADSPRGRLHLMRAVVEGRLEPDSPAFQTHIERCLGCRACEPVCPSGVEYGMLLERARQVAWSARRPGWTTRLLLGLVAHDRVRSVWLAGSRLLRWSRIPDMVLRLLPATPRLHTVRLALAMLAGSGPPPLAEIRARGPEREPGDAPAAESSLPGEGRTVGLLTGCVQEGLFARVNRATERVLRANGYTVVTVEGQGCCGALHAHAGALDEARRLSERNVTAFEAMDLDFVVTNAAGCGAAMRDYDHLLAHGGSGGDGGEDPGTGWARQGRAFASKVRDVSELLGGEIRPRRGASLPVRVAYDPPCHLLHGQGVRGFPERMLEAVPDLEVVAVPRGEECCGGAGIYGLTQVELGGSIGRDKVEAVRRTEAPWVATGNPGCMMQIAAGLRMEGAHVHVCHPVELLDESYRRAGAYGTPA